MTWREREREREKEREREREREVGGVERNINREVFYNISLVKTNFTY